RARRHEERLDVNGHEHATLAEQRRIPAADGGQVEAAADEGRPPRGQYRLAQGRGIDVAHAIPCSKRSSSDRAPSPSAVFISTVGWKTSCSFATGCSTSPNTWRYGKRSISRANSAASTTPSPLRCVSGRASSVWFRCLRSSTPGEPGRQG